jgi:thymidylate kinase
MTGKVRVVILGTDGAGKSSVIDGLLGKVSQKNRAARMRHLKPRMFMSRWSKQATIVVDPHGKPIRSLPVSLAKILLWLIEEWYARLFQENTKELLICDRYYHDLLVDPKRYRYGGPLWAARLIGMLMPQPNLWILLDASAEISQMRKQEVSPEESARQRQAYLAFIRTRSKHVIVDASQSLNKVIADVEQAITETILENDSNCE